MKRSVQNVALAAVLAFTLLTPGAIRAQFAEAQQGGGPVAVGQAAAQRDDQGKVAIVMAPPVQQAVPSQAGGVIQLSAFGWLEPYVDSVVQALLLAGLTWLGKSKYTQWMDETSRDALATFTRNTASSLIADGFVQMRGKALTVLSAALASEVNTAADRIPDAMKRFGLTPGALAQKIVDAIPQTPAGAQIVAAAHASDGEPAEAAPPANPPVAPAAS